MKALWCLVARHNWGPVWVSDASFRRVRTCQRCQLIQLVPE